MRWLKNLNTPNKLTLIRMLCVVLIVVFGMLELYLTNIASFTVLGLTYTWTRVVLLFLFIFGSITDFLDGNIARKRNQVTTFGKFLDPIADKLLVNTITIFLVLYGNINGIVLVLFLIRDTLVDGLRFVAAQKNVVIASSKLGKAKTISQMVAIIVVLVLQATPLNWAISIGEILAYIAALISLISGIDYIIKNGKVILPEDE